MHTGHYTRLSLMIGLHFIAMYVLMYAMVNAAGNVLHNLNQVYMAGLMTASMGLIEIALMGGMYPARKVNTAILVGSVIALAGFFLLIRQQAGIGDRQFLRSMIPHHAGAILMCRQASLTDERIRELCGEIITNQQSEIDLMKQIMR